jgi:phosphotransferase system enzyme I (PtsI)
MTDADLQGHPPEPAELRGVGVSPGVVVGPVARVVRPRAEPSSQSAADVDAEVAHLSRALRTVAEDLTARSAAASGEIAEILSATAMMAGDPALAGQAQQFVRDHRVSAQRAVWVVADEYAVKLAGLGGYLADRASDVRDVRDRVVAELEGTPPPGLPDPGHPHVLVATDLAPADTAGLDPGQVLALVTEQGGPTGHTAIIARSLGLASVVACPAAASLADGDLVRVDGAAGTVTTGLDPATPVTDPRARRSSRLGDGPHATADGHEVNLLANIGDAAGARRARGLGALGCGLFRSELLFLDRTRAPDIDEQHRAYREVLEALPGRVVVRTLDAGADKPLPFLRLDREPNPALGVRGLRVAFNNEPVLTDQLQAIASAAADTGTEVWVMAPMVATVREATWFRELCESHGLHRVGVMVEVPSAALLADELLGVVDFLSIGTNDLTQYTLAADRVSGPLAALNDPWQPAVLRLVKMTAAAGDRLGKPVGVCGEAAADPQLAAVLVGLGVTSLSADAGVLGDIAARLAAVTFQQCQRAADAALAATSPQAARAAAAVHLNPDPAGSQTGARGACTNVDATASPSTGRPTVAVV